MGIISDEIEELQKISEWIKKLNYKEKQEIKMSFKDEVFEGKLGTRKEGVFPKGTYWRMAEGGKAYIRIDKYNAKKHTFSGVVYNSKHLDEDTWNYWTNGVFIGSEDEDSSMEHLKYPYVQIDSNGKKLKEETKKQVKAEPKIKDIWVL